MVVSKNIQHCTISSRDGGKIVSVHKDVASSPGTPGS